MNLVLLFESDFISPTRVRLEGRRFEHIQNILKATEDQALLVGKANGLMGQGRIVSFGSKEVEIEVSLTDKPPSPLPLTLIIPMVRPPMFKRILFHATTLGVKKIYVLNFARVDGGLWNSSSLRPEEIQEQLVLGLEQAKDTLMPEVIIKERFKPFVEDELPAISSETLKF
jgi:16S rRNA (uracil1498-N3)-methyltransferase